MASKWLSIVPCAALLASVWVGCGGDSEQGDSSKAPDAGADTSTTEDAGSEDSGSSDSAPPTDGATDGSIPGTEVPITFGSCPTFTPCGGDPKGSWVVSGGCVSDAVITTAQEQCPGLTVVPGSVVVKAKGSLVVNATTITRQTQFSVAAKINLPKACVDQAGGICALVGFYLESPAGGDFDKATCVKPAGGDGCSCDVATEVKDVGSGGYTQSGTTITATGGPTYDFCQQTTKLQTRQQNVGVEAVLELTKQ